MGKSIKSEWNELASMIFDGSQGEIQIKETRKAFYAGACSMFSMLNEAGDLPEDQLTDLIKSLNSELDEHLIELKSELASLSEAMKNTSAENNP